MPKLDCADDRDEIRGRDMGGPPDRQPRLNGFASCPYIRINTLQMVGEYIEPRRRQRRTQKDSVLWLCVLTGYRGGGSADILCVCLRRAVKTHLRDFKMVSRADVLVDGWHARTYAHLVGSAH